jgi:general secretion pathway protein A
LPVGGYASDPQPAAYGPAGLDSEWLDRQHRGAWRGLAELWRDGAGAPAIRSACEGLIGTGYACIRDQGNWSRIRQLGLPVMLVLSGAEPQLLLLRGMRGETLLAGAGDAPSRLPRDAVEKLWFGEYLVAWPQAPDWPSEIHRGETGAAVDIVMEMASFAEPAWQGESVFDADFEGWLTRFQQRNGLKPDGIIGPNTLIHLMAPTIDEPRLVLEPEETS